MGIAIMAALAAAWAAGFVLFRRNRVPGAARSFHFEGKLSVIIPARNEETNLPHLLQSLRHQSCRPFEIIVVDDGSEDGTRAIAESFGAKVVVNEHLPPGWTGKNWAVWNGYRHCEGDHIAFLDADVRLCPHALEDLLAARQREGGAVSVVPYHETEKTYERLALIPNLLGLFAFTSPMERGNPDKGFYGSCILVKREEYERAKGHEGVRSEVMDDLRLGAKFIQAGIPVTNYIGMGAVSFRMYPDGIRSQLQGFAKGAILGTSKLSLWTTLLVAVWLLGLLASEAAPFLLGTSLALPLAIGYVLYTAQLFAFLRCTGRFGLWMPAVHMLSTVFFVLVMLYSVYQVAFFGSVAWKGRQVAVRRRGER
ncbi:glycosyltransferase [Paenibacillus sp. D51F]